MEEEIAKARDSRVTIASIYLSQFAFLYDKTRALESEGTDTILWNLTSLKLVFDTAKSSARLDNAAKDPSTDYNRPVYRTHPYGYNVFVQFYPYGLYPTHNHINHLLATTNYLTFARRNTPTLSYHLNVQKISSLVFHQQARKSSAPENIQRLFRLHNCLRRRSPISRKYPKTFPAAATSSSNQQQQQAAATSSSNQQQQPPAAISSSNQQQQSAAATNSSNQQQQSAAATNSSDQ